MMSNTHNPEREFTQSYELYDHIRVTAGTHRGRVAHIVDFAKDGMVCLYSPFDKKTCIVFLKDVEPC